MKKRPYLIRAFDLASQAGNTLLFNGKPDEPISARAWREERQGSAFWSWVRRFIDALFFLQDAHCRDAHIADIERALQRIQSHKRAGG